MREGTKHEVLILTDGESNCGRNISSVLPALHAKASVFGLMIGSFSDRGKGEVMSYVSKPTPHHLFAVKNFEELKQLLIAIKTQVNNRCTSFDQ